MNKARNALRYGLSVGIDFVSGVPSPDALPQTQRSDSLSDANFGSDTAHMMKHNFPSTDHIRSYSSFSSPAGNNRLSQELVQKTFVLSNISPQVGRGFNRGIWNRLEQYVRYRARKSINTWVCTGPLFLPYNESNGKKYDKYEVIGGNDVAVPTHFFKVLLVESAPNVFELECYVIQNKPMDDNIPLHAFQVLLNSIERAAGFLIFEKIPRNEIQKINGLNPYLQKFL
ncbi:endonuclease-like protein, partial [Dinothrombium tinctorium]